MPISPSPHTSVTDRDALAATTAGRRPRVTIARGATPWFVPTLATAAVTTALTRRNGTWALAAVPACALSAGMLWFFRDPEREIGTGRVISPPTAWCRASTPGRTAAPGWRSS